MQDNELSLIGLLTELKNIDTRVWYEWFNDYDIYGLDHGQLDNLQGCLYRSCERRNWPFNISYRISNYHAYIWANSRIFEANATSSVEALLKAYIMAMESV